MAAKKKPIAGEGRRRLSASTPPALAPEGHAWRALELPPARPPVRMIEGDPEAQAKELLRLLHEEAKVI